MHANKYQTVPSKRYHLLETIEDGVVHFSVISSI